MIPGSIHPLLAGKSEYKISNSLRFRRSNSPYMTRTAGTPTNAKIATWSFWHKRGVLGAEWVWGQMTAGASTFFTFDSGIAATLDSIRIYVNGTNLTSTPVFRDPSAWYHFVVAVDTTQATAADRIKVYVNNQAVTMSGTITLNADITFNVSGKLLKIGDGGWFATSADYIDGYLAEFNFIDGQALTPSSFGQTDSATGVWVPKAYTGTYGNNGFYLKFADASAATATAIGKDSSGNGNNWTPSGISVTSGTTFDQMTDTPTLNYAVLNAIDLSSGSLSAANMQWALNAGSARRGTFGMKSGKWYFECAITSGTNPDYFVPGIQLLSGATTGYGGTTQLPSGYGYLGVNGNKITGTTGSAYGSAFTTNDVIGVAFDADAGKIWFAKNGTWQASGDPAAGTNAAFSSITSGDYFPYVSNQTTTNNDHAGYVNFGQRPFSYTPPSGFKALNTANLSTPSIKKGSLYMDATLRTGTGATASVSSLSFAPDLVWIKSRSAATNNNLFDRSRGATVGLVSQTVTAEYTDTNSLTAFSSNGYSLGSDASSRGVNINTNTYVDWAWKQGATPGFDVVLYTGNGTNRTVSHSLGVAPACYVCKYRSGSNADEWFMYHKSLGATKYIRWSQALGSYTGSTYWNDTEPTSSVFSLGTNAAINTNSSLYVSYLWSEIEGFSKFSSYVGNGSADGPFVWCGFTPKWIYIKGDSASSGRQYDTKRLPYNQANSPLYFNVANAESAEAGGIDILSNGFKLRWSDSVLNGSGTTFIFMAFAENPFKYARAR